MDASGDRRLAVALLAASPRIALVRPGVCRADARGWDRRGGEAAFTESVLAVAAVAGFPDVRVGVADTGVAADVVACLADQGPRIVPPGKTREFLAPLPLSSLPISIELRETCHALGFRRIGDLARWEASDLELRFGPEGLEAHRWARGEDDGAFRPISVEEPPVVSFELEASVVLLEPLLFVLRHLLARVCTDLAGAGWCAAELALDLALEGNEGRTRRIEPARPTAREDLLFDLCRAVLERGLEEGRLASPVAALTLRVLRQAPAEARQGDLFTHEPRDPLAAAAVLSRLHARLGEESVVSPSPRADHRPETRNHWTPARLGEEMRLVEDAPEAVRSPLPAVLRLLSRPASVRVRTAGDRPAVVWDECGRHEVTAAEGPERLSGDWWKAPYRREYYRVCTSEGELLWLFREEGVGEGSARWRLHGWWD